MTTIMAESVPKSISQPNLSDANAPTGTGSSALLEEPQSNGSRTPSFAPSSPPTPGKLSRNTSFSNVSTYDDDSTFPPLDRLTVFDLLENLALPQRLEQLQNNVTESVRRQQQRLRSGGKNARDKVVEEWRRRVPTPDEQLDKYKLRMRSSIDKLGKQWSDRKNVTVREKVSFIAGVFNIFISGYLIGARPDRFHWWYAAQLAYFMPVRFYTYHQRGYHYFLADLCYFVNLLLVLSIWVFPQSKRLLISTFCLAFGNNAIAIAMWRNMLVFHSLDKVTRYVIFPLSMSLTRSPVVILQLADNLLTSSCSLFIHIMPCATLHCLVHLIPPSLQAERYPAIYRIKTAPRGSPYHYSPLEMLLWASVPYALWQANYYVFITVRRREKIAAGRLTSFVWLRRSYKGTFLGRVVNRQPEVLQEITFMGIQYSYAMLTTLPCALWFWYRWASAAFLISVFGWSVYNGATYYIDIFGRRFEKELEQLKKDVAKWQGSPDGMKTPLLSPENEIKELKMTEAAMRPDHRRSRSSGSESGTSTTGGRNNRDSVDKIPLLDEEARDASIDADGTSIVDKKNA